MKFLCACLLIGLLYRINSVRSNHVHVWRNNEKYNDKLFVDQFNFNEEPLHAISATSCGRLCTNLGISPAFSYRKKNCYCYASTPNSNSSYTNMRGAMYYTKEPITKSIACAEKKYTYLSNTDICYKIYDNIFELLNPADRCQSDGAHLIVLDTTEKLQDFQFLPKGNYYVIGLEKISGRWEWKSDRSVVFNTSLWNPGEPNGLLVPELCGGVGHFLTDGFGIVDIRCTYPMYICEI
ncbi:C-type lectin domain family 10 member A [Magallana gigas]|uniref:C-type lectin domain family 10 member A n=1 Tax=Magallana gigas TaxID=29159 RepID=UPI00333EC742